MMRNITLLAICRIERRKSIRLAVVGRNNSRKGEVFLHLTPSDREIKSPFTSEKLG